ncbi:hypothetical protein IJI91_00610 [Candidatus Saccharibacteria bacterium]|nr:hypothetical protein [Candidatus Saccharibacteria bacterium]
MKKIIKIKTILLVLAMMFLGAGIMIPSVSAVSCPSDSINGSADSLAECNIEKDDSFWPTITTIINVVLGLIAVIAVIMIIIGGIEYTVSRGDATKTKKGRDTIIYSVIGLVIALLSFAVVNFVLREVFDSGIKNKSSYIEVINTTERIG